jgi:hypothetical protein
MISLNCGVKHLVMENKLENLSKCSKKVTLIKLMEKW